MYNEERRRCSNMNYNLLPITREITISIVILFVLFICPLTKVNSGYLNHKDVSSTEFIWTEISHDYIREDAMTSDVLFKNFTHGWVVSQNKTGIRNGIILCTNDSGSSWHLQLYNETMSFFQIEIVTDTLWVSGLGGLYKSVNGGDTWEYITVGADIEVFNGIFFLNDTIGWTGSLLGIYRTVDGGHTWKKLTMGSFGDTPREFHFLNEKEGWVIGSFGIYHTVDGGYNWEMVHNKGGWTFTFLSSTEAWSVGDNMLAHMVDGKNWIEQPLPENDFDRPPYMTDIYFMNNTCGWIGASDPMIAHTQNGGIDWYEQSVSYDTRILAFDFINETHGWAVGWGGHIFRTTRANELGEYSWSTSNVALIYGVIFVLVAVVAVSIIFLRFRKRPSAVSPAPELE